jgi:hypothetical protein
VSKCIFSEIDNDGVKARNLLKVKGNISAAKTLNSPPSKLPPIPVFSRSGLVRYFSSMQFF